MFFNSFTAGIFIECHDQIIAKRCNTSKLFSNLSKYKPIQKDIIALVADAPLGPSAEVFLFGSRVIGVAEATSDLDIYVCIDGKSYSMNNKTEDHKNALFALKRALVKSKNWTCQMGESRHELPSTTVSNYVLTVVANAVVPVIKATYVPMKLECKLWLFYCLCRNLVTSPSGDINIMNNLATESSKMFAHMLKIQPEAISLFHFIKMWLNQQKFKHFRNYTLLLLVIFFLQSRNLMPSGKAIKRKAPAKVVDGKTISDQFHIQFSLIICLCFRLEGSVRSQMYAGRL